MTTRMRLDSGAVGGIWKSTTARTHKDGLYLVPTSWEYARLGDDKPSLRPHLEDT